MPSLVDSGQYGNNGCQGGNYKSAYAYIIKNGGISKQYNYRYKAKVIKIGKILN